MQYDEPIKQTKLTIREDRAVSLASRQWRAKLDCVGFNIVFIAERRPDLAVSLIRLMQEAGDLKVDSPLASEDGILAALNQLQPLMERYSKVGIDV